MKKSLFLCLFTGLTLSASAAEKALLAIPGATVYENKLDLAPGSPWKAAKGKWELVEGVMRGSELPEDKHISFVNGIHTKKGGKHVETVGRKVLTDFCELAKKKKEKGFQK